MELLSTQLQFWNGWRTSEIRTGRREDRGSTVEGPLVSRNPDAFHKDLSLITLVPKWTVSDSVVALEEFISSIESFARLGRWEEKDQVEIALLKLAGSAKTFYNGCPELHACCLTWQQLKAVLRNRYKDVHTGQYHYMKLQTTRQAKNEDPQAFADRCRELAQKIFVRWTTL